MTKGDLMDRIWPDAHVTEDSLVQCALEIRKALLGIGGLYWATKPSHTFQNVTVAVLPFQNMRGDPRQSYFANGLADDLIVDLSGLSGVRVI